MPTFLGVDFCGLVTGAFAAVFFAAQRAFCASAIFLREAALNCFRLPPGAPGALATGDGAGASSTACNRERTLDSSALPFQLFDNASKSFCHSLILPVRVNCRVIISRRLDGGTRRRIEPRIKDQNRRHPRHRRALGQRPTFEYIHLVALFWRFKCHAHIAARHNLVGFPEVVRLIGVQDHNILIRT
jgi:hypothetical protein